MDFFENNAEERAEINMVSLIDVVLLLVIFMMLSSHFVQKNGIKVDLPEAQAKELKKSKDYIITVTRKGKLLFQGKTVTMTGLKKKLTALYSPKNKEKTVIIKGDKRAKHGKVVAIMDLVKAVGFERLGIATEQKTNR